MNLRKRLWTSERLDFLSKRLCETESEGLSLLVLSLAHCRDSASLYTLLCRL